METRFGLIVGLALMAGCGGREPETVTPEDTEKLAIERANHRQRIWIGSSGSLRIEGEFVTLADGIVELRTTTGIVTKVPIDELTPADGRIAQALATSRGRTTRENTSSTLRAFRTQFRLNLSSTNVADDGVAILEELISLESLNLNDTKVTDAGLVHLVGLADLRDLYLDNTQVTDDGLAHLDGLAWLGGLCLSGTEVSDAGLEHLDGLTKLQSLDLSGTKVSDAGLKHLRGLTRLERLGIRETQVTDAGVAKLQAALPRCRIVR